MLKENVFLINFFKNVFKDFSKTNEKISIKGIFDLIPFIVLDMDVLKKEDKTQLLKIAKEEPKFHEFLSFLCLIYETYLDKEVYNIILNNIKKLFKKFNTED